jgi:4-hydroxymandelate oxidase
LAIEHGVAGVIVHHHGGRSLDTLPAIAELLPAVVCAVAVQVPVLVGGAIRRGTDLLKATLLGAAAVRTGKPVLHSLASGATGVDHVLRPLRDELKMRWRWRWRWRWRVAGGGWRVAGGGWRVAGGGWRVAGGRVAGI